MKRYVEIEPVCPFVGKKCIGDGWQWNSLVMHPCAFYDENHIYREYPETPCRIARAINKILDDGAEDDPECTVPDVPWDVEEGSADNVKKTR